MTKPTLQGIIPALVTPYDSAGRIDPDMAGRLVEALINDGIGGLYVGGSTGEGPLQSPDERAGFAEVVVEAAAGGVPVIVHVGTADTAGSIALAARAAEAGAQAVSAVAPYYYQHGGPELMRHFQELADASPLPFLPYYLAAGAGSDPAATYDLLFELAEHPNVIGMKYTSRDVYRLQQLVTRTRGEVAIFNGADEVCVHGLLAGAAGAIGSTYNFMAGLFVRAAELLRAGDATAAAALQAQANDVIAAAAGYNNVAFAREVVRARGLDVGPPRKPLQQLDDTARAEIAALVARTPFLASSPVHR